ncbi:MAG: 16S rRNA (adenine(1518)-N(6)/adenine(1519)-N(6))-dimethyltransferase RsmA [Acholeplasmataceae bacterium]
MAHQVKKRFGQNFIRDRNLLDKIVRESHIDGKTVIEIGPGQGGLTVALLARAERVIAYEIDATLRPYLDELEAAYENLSVIYGDFLDADLDHYREDIHVVANVPYYITTPILFRILETASITTASLMVQKEVAERLLAEPGMKQYNALSVILQYRARVYRMLEVNRQMFYPIPNVDSVVIRIEKEDSQDPPEKQERFIRFVKESFRQKRKTLVNNLHEAYGIAKSEIESFLVAQDVHPLTRAERISVTDFKRIAEAWPYD